MSCKSYVAARACSAWGVPLAELRRQLVPFLRPQIRQKCCRRLRGVLHPEAAQHEILQQATRDQLHGRRRAEGRGHLGLR